MKNYILVLMLFVTIGLLTTSCAKEKRDVPVPVQSPSGANPEQVRFCLSYYRGYRLTNGILNEISQCLLSR